MTFADALRLGRVSNLPTVWSNVLAGLVLAGGSAAEPALAALLGAMSLLYLAGMYLNDYFDAAVDARERPERPIPSGRVAPGTVAGAGFTMLALGVVLVAVSTRAAPGAPWPGITALALAGCIVLYDVWHKGNPLSPLLMGLCRVLVYLCAGVAVAVPPTPPLVAGAAMLLCHLVGLTWIARQENLARVRNLWPLAFLAVPVLHGAVRALEAPLVAPFVAALLACIAVALRYVARHGPGDIPRAVVTLIAGIALVDAVLVAAAGAPGTALVCMAAFGLTLALQRWVAGT